jgi:hypothetical protein
MKMFVAALTLAAALTAAAPAHAQYGSCETLPLPPSPALSGGMIYGHATVGCEGTTTFTYGVCLQIFMTSLREDDAYWADVVCDEGGGSTTPTKPFYDEVKPGAYCPGHLFVQGAGIFRTLSWVSWTIPAGLTALDGIKTASAPVPLMCVQK